MSTEPVRAQRCDRAREWISLQVDGEISGLECAVLDAHLLRCDACRGFQVDIAGITRGLREAPLEALGHRVMLPRKRGYSRSALQLSAASVAALAVGVGVLGLLSSERGTGPALTRDETSLFQSPRSELRWFPEDASSDSVPRGHRLL